MTKPTVAAEKLTSSQEDYLEAIFHIAVENQAARAKDISARLGVSGPSVTSALKALVERGLINYTPYGIVTLTEKGRDSAQGVIRRHVALTEFLYEILQVDKGESEKAACLMEHAVSDKILDRLCAFLDYMRNCPQNNAKWVQGRGYQCEGVVEGVHCDSCQSYKSNGTPKNGGAAEPSGPENEVVALSSLEPGQKARIVRLRGTGLMMKRIADMGVTPGTRVDVMRLAPLGDPMELRVKGYYLSLRKTDAAEILVRPL